MIDDLVSWYKSAMTSTAGFLAERAPSFGIFMPMKMAATGISEVSKLPEESTLSDKIRAYGAGEIEAFTVLPGKNVADAVTESASVAGETIYSAAGSVADAASRALTPPPWLIVAVVAGGLLFAHHELNKAKA